MRLVAETERLYLREYVPDDFESLHEMLSDPDTMRFYPAPFTERQTRDWITRNRNRYQNDGCGLWAVCLKHDHTFIGDCGLVVQQVDRQEDVEIGYHIHRSLWGRGYATEAAVRCRELAFGRYELARVISIIAPKNLASIRVAEKVGMRLEKEAIVFGKLHRIYAVENRSPS